MGSGRHLYKFEPAKHLKSQNIVWKHFTVRKLDNILYTVFEDGVLYISSIQQFKIQTFKSCNCRDSPFKIFCSILSPSILSYTGSKMITFQLFIFNQTTVYLPYFRLKLAPPRQQCDHCFPAVVTKLCYFILHGYFGSVQHLSCM
jgi:hypothetical protein